MNLKTIYALAFGSLVGFALVHYMGKRAGAARAAPAAPRPLPYTDLDLPVDDWLDAIKMG